MEGKKIRRKKNFIKIIKPLNLKNLNKFTTQKFLTKNLEIVFKNSKQIKLDKNNNAIYSLLDGKIVNFQENCTSAW